MKLRTFLIISFISTGTFITANVYSWALPEPMSEETVLGKQVWQENNCISCHTLFGNGGYEGDDLTQIVNRRSPEDLISFLTNPPIMRPNIMKQHPGLTTHESEYLVSYFEFLNTIPTLGWPPEPHEVDPLTSLEYSTFK